MRVDVLAGAVSLLLEKSKLRSGNVCESNSPVGKLDRRPALSWSGGSSASESLLSSLLDILDTK